ncbi:DUF4136 domain-containing protein [Marinobacter fonticola]|uniref:DUF4136 domain-containing protein n=1 Tax=Marinobacter fonticola TaxID=2603215 RepID=UPI0011E73F84|nr:DUF4136 domain-containing protein [Marinobacter fonticola]
METIPDFCFIPPVRNIPSWFTHRLTAGFRRFIAVMSALIFSACSLQPVQPLALDAGAQPLPESARTFHIDVRPAPGRFRFLGKVEHAVISQLKNRGYELVDQNGDFSILIRLSRTDRIVPMVEPVESGRLLLYLRDGDTTLRTGRTPNLNSIDLDFMQDDEIAERVRLFLQGVPKRNNGSS